MLGVHNHRQSTRKSPRNCCKRYNLRGKNGT
jgi:hypothetical protein